MRSRRQRLFQGTCSLRFPRSSFADRAVVYFSFILREFFKDAVDHGLPPSTVLMADQQINCQRTKSWSTFGKFNATKSEHPYVLFLPRQAGTTFFHWSAWFVDRAVGPSSSGPPGFQGNRGELRVNPSCEEHTGWRILLTWNKHQTPPKLMRTYQSLKIVHRFPRFHRTILELVNLEQELSWLAWECRYAEKRNLLGLPKSGVWSEHGVKAQKQNPAQIWREGA